ncbi:protein kinase, partial [Gemmatimonadota bacterium]
MMIGKSIGQYEILEKIGEGGMGEVYLAQDSTLDRKVALKFLRSDLQFDVTAKQRLIREAKAVAALNHPYICSIYGVCEENTEVYLVMELIEGETLQERLLKGAIPIREALRISVEITEALEKAHQNSIVHRDLKPSNIMLTPEGHAKVMDFGLAKTIKGASGVEEHIHSLSMSLTDQDMVVGTVSYMSPEQIKALPVDTRSDIFSFGLLFFEMITGHHPFRTDSPLETAAAIIGLDTPPLPESLGEFRDSITSFLMTVLAKDVEQRPGSFKQIRESLLALLEETTAVQLMDLPLTRQVPTGILAGGIIIITAMILMVVQLIGKSTRSDSLGTFGTPESFLVTPLVRDRAPSWHPVPGTDLIVFESDKDGNFDVCMDNLDGDPTNLTHENPGFDGKPVWSPDGNSIAYVSDRQGLGIYIMDSKGFSDKKVTDLSRLPGEFGWRMSWRHPEWIVYSNQRPDDKKWNIYAVSPDGKRLRNLTEQWDMNAYCADLTINGRYLLIIGGGLSGGLVDRRLFVMDLDSGKVLDLFPDQADERSTAIANPMQ